MKKIILLSLLFVSLFANAQAYKGKGDTKFQVGPGFQTNGTSIVTSADFGIGENMSYGFVASYILNNSEVAGFTPAFEDRFDAKARFNANIGNVLKLDEKLDIYPGLNLGLRNFGAHLGVRYFFTDGFGIYSEAAVPIARYNSNLEGYRGLNNQFVFTFGACFNL